MVSLMTLKWRGENVDIQVPEEATVADLADLIFDRTRVPPDRQMVMIPGLKITKAMLAAKSPEKLSTFGQPKPTMKGTLVGTPIGDEFVINNVQDNTEHKDIAKEEVIKMPVGYVNIGNTCYLGSVLAMLESCEPFRKKIINAEGSEPLLKAWRETWQRKDIYKAAAPAAIFAALGQLYPEFTETKPGSVMPQMQDAEECLTKMLAALPSSCNWRELFEFKLKETSSLHPSVVESLGAVEDVPTETINPTYKLCCYMGSAQKTVAFMFAGIELSMRDELEKMHPTLQQNFLYQRERKIVSLPPFMIVHMVRFEWKKAAPLAGGKAGRAKILRRVEYPTTFDLYPFCDDELKGHLQVGRREDEKRRAADLEESKRSLEAGLPANKQAKVDTERRIATGAYKLRALVTHIGRGASDGHYICWLWQDEQWVKMDDNKSMLVGKDAVDLQGGLADGPCPYILLYEREGEVSNETIVNEVHE